jgi:SAM-dependent methyltransferase
MVVDQSIQGWEKRVRVIQACRLCGGRRLRPVMDLGSQCLAGLFDDGRPENRLRTPIPLEVVICDPSSGGCGFIQLRHSVPPDLMFQDYGYRSGLNESMRRHLEELSGEIESRLALKAGEVVVDIGANDGTALLAYREPGLVRLGFEPSNAALEAEQKGVRILRGFFTAQAGAEDFEKECPGRKARAVTTIAMFYDIEDPAGFCRQIHRILAEDGLWVVELHYWGSMLETNAFDAICHEHLGYYSLSCMNRLAQSCGFRLEDVTFNSSNGGSMRCSFGKASGRSRPDPEAQRRIDRAFVDEQRAAVHSPERFARFQANAARIRSLTQELVRQAARAGKSVYGYGASTKGNVLLQYCGFGPEDLVAIADRSPAKWGRRTPGTSIPICSEDEMRRAQPDLLLILPWHFLEGFFKREKELRAGGTRFIVPFPEPRIV